MPEQTTTARRFTLRRDRSMGCYRVNVPNLDGPVDVVTVDALLSDEFLQRAFFPLGPDDHTFLPLARKNMQRALAELAEPADV